MIRNRIFEIIEPAKSNDHHSRVFDNTILILIIFNVISVILESFSSIALRFQAQLDIFEIISITIFSIEYLLRIITSNLLYRENDKARAVLKYIYSPMAIIDLFAILPFFIPMILPVDLRFLRILRLTRILRIFKINRYTTSLSMIGRVLKKKKEELIVTLFVTFLLILLAASVMYYVETDIQPDGFPNILASLWWAVATLTTVGYGDVYPLSVLGKILSGIIALLGIGLVALPTGIISSGFTEELENKKQNYNRSAKAYKYKKRKKVLKRK
ncbi:ion transporter [Spirochaeta isovalerica]|uniref:Voltage-gated potassium channel n=1 Tax=Spirochaeta isovalerica TaxID=150 RepID=A0A841RFF1_9SPIO|nr:ion transporter [Spirochaeta isovalerica]MBB6482703.1 voltage-gated potassium channel [Spirochaeta isovalerica]